MFEENPDWEYLQRLEELSSGKKSNNPKHSYSILTEQLFRKLFEWSVSRDDNRISDGLAFRKRFADDHGYIYSPDSTCSMLELMLGLSERLAFLLSDESEELSYWFRVLLQNTGLVNYTDDAFINDYAVPSEVDNILDRIIFRQYDSDGAGGFFPLSYPTHDMRRVELWYQMQYYAIERSPF